MWAFGSGLHGLEVRDFEFHACFCRKEREDRHWLDMSIFLVAQSRDSRNILIYRKRFWYKSTTWKKQGILLVKRWRGVCRWMKEGGSESGGFIHRGSDGRVQFVRKISFIFGKEGRRTTQTLRSTRRGFSSRRSWCWSHGGVARVSLVDRHERTWCVFWTLSLFGRVEGRSIEIRYEPF